MSDLEPTPQSHSHSQSIEHNRFSTNLNFSVTAKTIHQVHQVLIEGFEMSETQLISTARLKEDLGLDSLDAVDMLVYIEDRFKTKISGERLLHVKTLNDVYLLVEEYNRKILS